MEEKKEKPKFAETVSKRGKILFAIFFWVLPWFIAGGLGFVHDVYKLSNDLKVPLLFTVFSPFLLGLFFQKQSLIQ